jgi:hypothetical protein
MERPATGLAGLIAALEGAGGAGARAPSDWGECAGELRAWAAALAHGRPAGGDASGSGDGSGPAAAAAPPGLAALLAALERGGSGAAAHPPPPPPATQDGRRLAAALANAAEAAAGAAAAAAAAGAAAGPAAAEHLFWGCAMLERLARWHAPHGARDAGGRAPPPPPPPQQQQQQQQQQHGGGEPRWLPRGAAALARLTQAAGACCVGACGSAPPLLPSPSEQLCADKVRGQAGRAGRVGAGGQAK